MSDIAHPNCQLETRHPFQTLSDKSINKDHINPNQIENINFEIINKIETQLYHLQNISKSDENIFQISQICLEFVYRLKRDYCDIYTKLQNELSKNSQFSNSFSNINTKSNSVLSIVDIKMEINEFDSLNKLIDNIDLNKNPNQKSIDSAINTDLKSVESDQSTQTQLINNNCDDKMIGKFPTILVLHHQAIDLRQLALKLTDKNRLIGEKLEECVNQLSKMIPKPRCEVGVGTLESIGDLEKRQRDLEEIQQRLHEYKIDNDRLSMENEDLSYRMAEMSIEMKDIRDENEFLNTEHQGLIAQINRMQADWKANLELYKDRLLKAKSELRERNTNLVLECQAMEFKLGQEQIFNNEDKIEIERLQKRLNEYDKDVREYPMFGSDLQQQIVELKIKVTRLKDKRIAHAYEKQKLIAKQKDLMKEVSEGNSELNRKITGLEQNIASLQEENRIWREKFEQYSNFFERLLTVSLDPANRTVENYVESHQKIFAEFVRP